jgi:hypothetical protein
LLSVSAGAGAVQGIKAFQVVLFDQRIQWETPGGCLDLEVFSSDSGDWTARRLSYPLALTGFQCFVPPCLGRSGKAAYWLGLSPRDLAIAYSSVHHSIRLMQVPSRAHDMSALNRCMWERHDEVLRYAHFDAAEFQVWDLLPTSEQLRWTLIHRATVNDVVRRSPGAASFFSSYMLRWMAASPQALWCTAFELIGFDPADDDVVFFFQAATGRLAAYSIRLGKLNLRCQLLRGTSLASFSMFPYMRPRRPADIPGMQCLAVACAT